MPGRNPHGPSTTKKPTTKRRKMPSRRTKVKRPTHSKEFLAKYEVKEKLGHGNFAEVKRVVRRTDGKSFACKIIRKEKVPPEDMDDLVNEVQILTKVDGHKHCVHTIEVIDSTRKLYIVMELLGGGELFKQICAQGHFSEQQASQVVRQIAMALQHMHAKGVTHRDLKPENLMYKEQCEKGVVGTLVVTDFGLASQVQMMETACGSPMYAAPEVLATTRAYNNECDVWSLGVITYILLCGYPPFYHQQIMKMYGLIRRGQFEFPKEDWDQISDGAKRLITRMLVVDPRSRVTVEGILCDPWITDPTCLSQEPLPLRMVKNLRNMMLKGRLRKAVHAVMAVLALKEALEHVETEEEVNGFSNYTMLKTQRLQNVKELNLEDFNDWADDHFADDEATAKRVQMVATHLWGEEDQVGMPTPNARRTLTHNLKDLQRSDFAEEQWISPRGTMHHMKSEDVEEVMNVLHPRAFQDGDWIKAKWNGRWNYAKVIGYSKSLYELEIDYEVESKRCRRGEKKPRIAKMHLKGFQESDLKKVSNDVNICKWQGQWVNSEGVEFQIRGNECRLVTSAHRFYVQADPDREGYYKMNKWSLQPADIRADQIVWRRKDKEPIYWFHKSAESLAAVRKVFEMFSHEGADGRETIPRAKLAAGLERFWGRKPTASEVDEIMRKHDFNKDGKLQFDEFVELFGSMGLDRVASGDG